VRVTQSSLSAGSRESRSTVGSPYAGLEVTGRGGVAGLDAAGDGVGGLGAVLPVVDAPADDFAASGVVSGLLALAVPAGVGLFLGSFAMSEMYCRVSQMSERMPWATRRRAEQQQKGEAPVGVRKTYFV
jgi:hypothetical protein